MNIGFDISQAGEKPAGCGVLAKGFALEFLKKNVDAKITFYGTFGPYLCDKALSFDIDKSQKVLKQFKYNFKNIKTTREFWLEHNIESKIGLPDIIHSNNFWCPTNVKVSKIVYTLYDLSFLEMPEATTNENINVCLNGLVNAVQYADHFVAISHYTKKNFLEYFPCIHEDKITVIYPGIKHQSKKPNHPFNFLYKKDEFFLSVGTIEPRKNYIRLIKSYAKYLLMLNNRSKPKPLIIVGGDGWGNVNIKEFIVKSNLGNYVFFLGYVTENELSWLYSNTYCNIYVSLFEGFGFPVLEGMKHGVPTITSNITSIPEIVGTSAILINPLNEIDISNALINIHNNENYRNILAKESVTQSLKFNWSLASDQLMKLYENIIYN